MGDGKKARMKVERMKQTEKLLLKLDETAEHLDEMRKVVIEIAFMEGRTFSCIFCHKKIKPKDFRTLEQFENACITHNQACVDKLFGKR